MRQEEVPFFGHVLSKDGLKQIKAWKQAGAGYSDQ